MHESGKMMRSALEWLMSRSCHSATFSSATTAFPRTTRAKPLSRSLVIGLRLCGMAELPFCPSVKNSSTSSTSVRCRWRNSVAQRDRHAEFVTTLALIASSIDRWATEFRHLQRTEVLEVEEFFGEGQKGSSAMPHKRNPITNERLSGLARVVRGNAVVALENVALWHERDISHSSAERIILPDSCILLDYMLAKLRDVVGGLRVYPDRMAQNLALTKGLYFSQAILLALTKAGTERKDAYEAVQRAAMKTWKGEGTFAENAKREPEITAKLSSSEIDDLCSLDIHFKHVDATFKALGLD